MLTKIFCEVDDFMMEFEGKYKSRLLEDGLKKSKYNSKLSMSEAISILIYYHNYGNRTFKDFYIKTVSTTLKSYFPNLVSYNRFIELIPTLVLPMFAFLQLKKLLKSDKITFIDSTRIAVCNNKRIEANKVFKGIAKRGKSTMGWFYGFKLHIAINEKGELSGFSITSGNIDDRNQDMIDSVLQNVSGKLFGDKGYISKKLFNYLYDKGITLVTNVKKNMKNRLIPIFDKLLLRKRSIIETVNDQLKNMCNIEHSRHRSPYNFFANILAGLIRYTYFKKKPSINFSENDWNILHSTIPDIPSNNDNKGLLLI